MRDAGEWTVIGEHSHRMDDDGKPFDGAQGKLKTTGICGVSASLRRTLNRNFRPPAGLL